MSSIPNFMIIWFFVFFCLFQSFYLMTYLVPKFSVSSSCLMNSFSDFPAASSLCSPLYYMSAFTLIWLTTSRSLYPLGKALLPQRTGRWDYWRVRTAHLHSLQFRCSWAIFHSFLQLGAILANLAYTPQISFEKPFSPWWCFYWLFVLYDTDRFKKRQIPFGRSEWVCLNGNFYVKCVLLK